jgi:hypothetical protein
MMEGQMDIFSYMQQLEDAKKKPKPKYEKLSVGDVVGKIILGDVYTGIIQKVEGNDRYFFYRTENGCFDWGSRTDIEQMEKEAEQERKKYKTIEIDKLEKFFAVEYPPRECDGHILNAMVGIFDGMLFYKGDVTYQFLEKVANLEKEYSKKVYEMTHYFDELRDYKELEEPIKTRRLYWSNTKKLYSDARYVLYNP